VEKEEILADAEDLCSNVEPIGIQKVEVAEQGGQENGKREIPEHLTNLFDKSKGELNGQEQTFEVLISHPWWLPLLYTPLP
jgi:hypothetical protein